MVHWRYVLFLFLWLLVVCIQFFRFFFLFRDLFKGKDIFVIDTAEQTAIEGLYGHYFGPFPIVYLFPVSIQHSVVVMIKLNGMATVNRSFVQYGKDQVDFFILGLRFKHRFATMDGKGELLIEFLYVGV